MLPPDAKRGAPGHDRAVPPNFFLPHEPTALKPTIVSGVPHLESLGPEAARARFAASLEALYAAPLRADGLSGRYVPDFLPVPDSEPGGPRPFLILQRRVRPEEDTEAAWRDFEERLARYREGRLDVPAELPGYPSPP